MKLACEQACEEIAPRAASSPPALSVVAAWCPPPAALATSAGRRSIVEQFLRFLAG